MATLRRSATDLTSAPGPRCGAARGPLEALELATETERTPEDGWILETQGLTRRFGVLVAVDRLDIRVARGDIFGFLGPNGAGKTTTIRMLLRLIRPTGGRILVLGKELEDHPLEVLAQVGALIESPAFYPYLSGRRNLDVFGHYSGGVPRARVDEVLDLVGLRDRADDPARVYSHGMKQRLGIGQALLTRPKILFLDEPTNGLDPPGIEEMRRLFRRLASEEGVTVFLSSHLLHEVEILCNRVAILNRGKLLVQGAVETLLDTEKVRVILDVDRSEEAFAAISRLGWCQPSPGLLRDGRIGVIVPRARTAELNRTLVQAGFDVSEFAPHRPSLEEFFRERLGLEPHVDETPSGPAGGSGSSGRFRLSAKVPGPAPAPGKARV